MYSKRMPKYIISLMIFIFLFTGVGCADTTTTKPAVQSQTTTSKTQTSTSKIQPATQKSKTINKNNKATTVTGQLKIHYINVGQGDSILAQQGSSNMLIDTGTNASTSSLMSYLQSLNVKKIDVLVLTHPHEDHSATRS